VVGHHGQPAAQDPDPQRDGVPAVRPAGVRRCALDAITQREVRAWVASLTVKGLAPATVHKAYQLFAKTMAAALDGGMLAQSPCRGVALPKVEHEEMRYLNPAEIACLAEVIRPGYQALVFVGAYGGLRIGELAGLRRSLVDLDAGTVDVAETVVEVEGRLLFGPPKTRAGRRRIRLPRRVVDELALHLRAPEPDGPMRPELVRCGGGGEGI
jgi:integrase